MKTFKKTYKISYEDKFGWNQVEEYDAIDRHSAVLYGSKKYGDKYVGCSDGEYNLRKLIAERNDLLEALQDCRKLLKELGCGNGEVCQNALKAINKAL